MRSPSALLTQREHEVFALLVEGVPTKLIAHRLGITSLKGALSHQPFLLVSTYLLAGVGFNKVNGLANQSMTAREPLLARCDNA